MKRHRFKQSDTPEDRLAAEARRLRDEASLLQPGAAREELIRKARKVEAGAQMSKLLRSPGLQPSKRRVS